MSAALEDDAKFNAHVICSTTQMSYSNEVVIIVAQTGSAHVCLLSTFCMSICHHVSTLRRADRFLFCFASVVFDSDRVSSDAFTLHLRHLS
jgi:hypothetical protein